MSTNTMWKRISLTACSLCLVAFSGSMSSAADNMNSQKQMKTTERSKKGDAFKNANEQIRQSVQVVKKMETDPGLKTLLQRAKGVFIAPHYGRVALGVGGRGGEGVLLVKQAQGWTDPAFYNFGGVSIGAQAGIEGGSIAFILNNDKAVNNFKQDNKFSLNADAGLTVVNWSAKGQASAGKGDVVVWSDTKGLFGDLAVSVSDINFDEEETSAFYGKKVAARNIIEGHAKAPEIEEIALLKRALPSEASTMSGGSTEKK